MGNKVPKLTEEQLEDLQDCTYFTRKEILRIQQKFVELDPQNIPQVSSVDSFILGKLTYIRADFFLLDFAQCCDGKAVCLPCCTKKA